MINFFTESSFSQSIPACVEQYNTRVFSHDIHKPKDMKKKIKVCRKRHETETVEMDDIDEDLRKHRNILELQQKGIEEFGLEDRRRLVFDLLVVVFYPQKAKMKKVPHIWKKRPSDWDLSVPFVKPNDDSSKSKTNLMKEKFMKQTDESRKHEKFKRGNKNEMKPMINYLLDQYKQKYPEVSALLKLLIYLKKRLI